jgi:hypothetical protein
MAFTTTQSIDTVLLRGINFRTTGNANISTQYILYANGQGQTYWSNTITPANLSTFSTSLANSFAFTSTVNGALFSTFSTNIGFELDTMQISDANFSTSLSILGTDITNTSNSLTAIVNANTQQVTNLTNQFVILSNTLNIRVDAIYTSTTLQTFSILQGVSSISTYTRQLNDLLSTIQFGLSTVSTASGRQNASTFSVLTSNFNSSLNGAITSTTQYIDATFAAASGNFVTSQTLSSLRFSTLSSITAVSTASAAAIASFSNAQRSTNTGIVNNYIAPLSNTTIQQNIRITNLEVMSTTLRSTINTWVIPLIGDTVAPILTPISNAVEDLQLDVEFLFDEINLLSTTTGNTVIGVNNALATQTSTIQGNSSNIASLQREFSTLTTSSILAGVYDTFTQLAQFTSTLVGSTISGVGVTTSTIYTSTVDQNNSIATSFFNFYVSTLYASTLSTLVPSTFSLTSSLVSSLYSTGFSTLTSQLNSTTVNITRNFISTTNGLTQTVVLSSAGQLNSSINGYLSTPANAQLSTFSSLSFIALSTFSFSSIRALNTNSTLFFSSYNFYNFNYSTLLSTSIALCNAQFNNIINFAVNQTVALSSFSTNAGRQLATQSAQFGSTINAYASTLNIAINSTNTSIIRTTNAAANSTLVAIQNSTVRTYNDFVSTLLINSASVTFSTLYTVQTIDLTSNRFIGSMDLVNARNFEINIRNITDLSTQYVLTYTSNSVADLDYRRGVITINVSTPSQNYTLNNGRLRFDAYRWGIPTTVWGEIYPFLCNADYSIQYEYTIIKSIMYTNLLNVFPRITLQQPFLSLSAGSVQVGPTLFALTPSASNIWRGAEMNVQWSNYMLFPFQQIGAPPFNPEILIDVQVGSPPVSFRTWGPYPLSVSSVMIRAPYLSNQNTPLVPCKARIYVNGAPMNAIEVPFTTVMPTFNSINYSLPNLLSGRFLAASEIVAITDTRRYPVFGAPQSMFGAQSPNGYTFYNQDERYSFSNLVRNYTNAAGFVGTGPRFISSVTTFGGVTSPSTFFQNPSPTHNYFINYNLVPNAMKLMHDYKASFTLVISSTRTASANVAFNVNAIEATSTATLFNFRGNAPASYVFSNADNCVMFLSNINFNPATYTPSTFVGPFGNGANPLFNSFTGADNQASATIDNMGLTAVNDPVSSILFRGPLSATSPGCNISTSGNRLLTYFTIGGTVYASTINIGTALSTVQTFAF